MIYLDVKIKLLQAYYCKYSSRCSILFTLLRLLQPLNTSLHSFTRRRFDLTMRVFKIRINFDEVVCECSETNVDLRLLLNLYKLNHIDTLSLVLELNVILEAHLLVNNEDIAF